MNDNEKTIWRCPECETVNSGEKCIVCGMEHKVQDKAPNESTIDWDKIERKAGHGATNWDRYRVENNDIEKDYKDSLLWFDLAGLIFVLIYFWSGYFYREILCTVGLCSVIGFICRLDINENTEKKFVAFSPLLVILICGCSNELGLSNSVIFWGLLGVYIGSILRIKIKKKYRSGKDE